MHCILFVNLPPPKEPEAGSDATHQHTSAIDKGDHYVLNGVKNWITNGSTTNCDRGRYVIAPQKN